MEVQNCSHEDVYNGVCCSCGLCMVNSGMNIDFNDDFSTSHQRRGDKLYVSFEKDLRDKNIPEEIKDWVYKKTVNAPQKTHRMGSREQIIYAYVYQAYLSLGVDFDPTTLAELLGTEKSNIRPAIKLASGISSVPLPQSKNNSVTTPLVIISPITYLKKNLEQLRLLKYYDEIKDIAEEALEQNSLLYEEKPSTMALGFIKYYTDKYDIEIPSDKKRKVKIHIIFKITSSSLDLCVRKISQTLEK
jgi:hypothetical protein